MNPNHAKSLKKAQDYLASGKAERAENLCRKLLKHKEIHLQTRVTLAKALVAQQKLSQAANYMGEAAQSQPDNVALQVATADMRTQLGDHSAALPFYEHALSRQETNSTLWQKYLNAILQIHLDENEKTESTASATDLVDVAGLAAKALELFPSDLSLVETAGQIFFHADMFEAALATLQKCLNVTPAMQQAHRRVLEIHHLDGKFQANIEHANQYGQLLSDDPIAMRAIAAAYENRGLMREALSYLDRAIELKPDEIKYYGAKGRCQMYAGEFDQALKNLNFAVNHDADNAEARANRCLTQKSLGNIAEAAKDELARLEVVDKNAKFHLNVPTWDGTPLNGRRLFIWSDQGVGDVFKFAPLIHEIDCSGGHIILASQEKTLPFLRTVLPDIELRPLPKRRYPNGMTEKDNVSPIFAPIDEDFDLQIPLGALYTFFRPDIASFKANNRIFQLPDEIRAPYQKLDMLSSKESIKVGLAWSSMNKNDIVARNYLPLDGLMPILTLPGFEFFNFQYTVKEEEIDAFRAKHSIPLYHAPGLDLFDDLLGTAAFNSCMDLFVSPACTSSDISSSLGIKTLRADLIHMPENLGQDYVPWYRDTDSIQVSYDERITDHIDAMKNWLIANQAK